MCDRAIWLTHGSRHRRGRPGRARRGVHRDDARRAATAAPTAASAAAPARSRSTAVELFVGDEHDSPSSASAPATTSGSACTTRADKPVPRPVFGLAIEHLGGATVTAPCTRDVGLIPECARRARATIDVAVDDVSLLPGTYDLHTAITDFNRSARVRQPAPGAAVRRDERQAVRDRRARHAAPAVDDCLTTGIRFQELPERRRWRR